MLLAMADVGVEFEREDCDLWCWRYDGLHQECQLEEFVEQETRDYRSFGVADAVEDLLRRVAVPFVERGWVLGC